MGRRLVLAALLLSGLAVALCPPPYRWVGLLQAAAVLAAGLRAPGSGEHWVLANTTFAIGLAILVAARMPVLLAASMVLAWLAVHRAWTAQRLGALQGALLLAGLQGVMSMRLLPVDGQGWLLAGLLLVIPAALARIHQPGLTPQLLALALGVISVATGNMFAAEAPAPAPPQRAVGFSRDVSLGDLGPLHEDPTVLARLHPEGPLSDEVYLRGIILDRFTGQGWVSSAPRTAQHVLIPENALSHRIDLFPLTGGVLLGVPPVAGMTGMDGLSVWRDELGTWRHTGALRPVSYMTLSTPVVAPGGAADPGRWLGLPADLDPRIRSLAARIAEDAPEDRAGRVAHTVSWMRAGYTYTLVPEPATARQALSTFLFDSQRGHCEYFATALAVLLRAQGIEARVVTGVRGTETAEDGTRLFRQKDAHAWVEVYFPDSGWTGVDGTPPELRVPPAAAGSENGPVDGEPAPTLPMSRGWLVGGICGLLVLTGGIWARWVWRDDPLLRRYRAARRLVARRGWTVPPSLPPAAAGAWLVNHAGEAGQPLAVLAMLLYRHRYGGEEAGILMAEADTALRRLRRLPHCRLTRAPRRVN